MGNGCRLREGNENAQKLFGGVTNTVCRIVVSKSIERLPFHIGFDSLTSMKLSPNFLSSCKLLHIYSIGLVEIGQ